ncbi:MAG: hypothetical protein USCGTAYLOR_01642 [Chromatiales bacterium USCg_Taylor]|nr:MAG: hypothetical protein USCGTAYLOR_01642 [Chromatiales bacterium USCg_Taylor]
MARSAHRAGVLGGNTRSVGPASSRPGAPRQRSGGRKNGAAVPVPFEPRCGPRHRERSHPSGRDEPAPREEPQRTATRRALHDGNVPKTEKPSFVKLHPFLAIGYRGGQSAAAIHTTHLPSLGQCYRPSGFEKYLRIARPEIYPLALGEPGLPITLARELDLNAPGARRIPPSDPAIGSVVLGRYAMPPGSGRDPTGPLVLRSTRSWLASIRFPCVQTARTLMLVGGLGWRECPKSRGREVTGATRFSSFTSSCAGLERACVRRNPTRRSIRRSLPTVKLQGRG